MSLREVLVPVRGDGKGEEVLNHAIALAQRFNAHIDVVHCRAKPTDLLAGIRIPQGMRDQIAQSAQTSADTDDAYLSQLFRDYCARHNLAICDDRPWPLDQTTARWRTEFGDMPTVVGQLGRVYDMTILARPDAKRNLGYRTLKAALLQSGRPALLCPPTQGVASIALKPTIAWNGSTETARTIDAAMPLLYAAGRVHIMTVDTGDQRQGPTEEALADHLRSHRFEVSVEVIKADQRQITDRLLAGARAIGSDCLITGAFGHTRKFEFMMGSVTQELIDSSDIPLLMMH